jgi:Mn-dependent DtxR family transcriptional regulator
MKKLPSISAQINEKTIHRIIKKNFSKLAPFYYNLINNWLIRAYSNYNDIDKFIIIIYLINKDLIFFRRNGLIIDYDTFYKDKTVEIEKINISDISKDLQIPKESIRRKVLELEKKGVIKKTGKKIFVDRSAFYAAQAINTLKDLTVLLHEFSKVLKKDKIGERIFEPNEISDSIKNNFSFCWYQFYKFLFIFTNRWRAQVKDLETFCVGFLVMLNASHNKSFRVKDLNIKKYQKSVMSADDIGLNAMSISEITKIPRPTVVRKLQYLIDNDYLSINKKKLITVNIRGKAFKISTDLQNKNVISLSNFIFRLFNQIKFINSN